MQSERPPDQRYYECRSCRARVPPLAYRASCPECGGSLRVVTDGR